MNAKVAAARGLRGTAEDLGPNKGTKYEEVVNGQFAECGDDQKKIFFKRSKLYREEDQQVAEISISHDGDYAVAICMSVEEADHKGCIRPFAIDDGSGDPIHEPEWGDRGFLDALDIGIDKGMNNGPDDR